MDERKNGNQHEWAEKKENCQGWKDKTIGME